MKHELRLKKLNPNDERMQIVKWHCQDLQNVTQSQRLLEVATSKSVIEVAAENSGYIRKVKNNGQWANAGEVIALFFSDLESAKAFSVTEEKSTIVGFDRKEFSFTRFSESAEALIEELKLDRTLFANMGLVTKSIVEAIAKEKGLLGKAPTQWVAKSPFRQEDLSLAKLVEIERLSIGASGGLVSSLTVQFSARPVMKHIASLPGASLRGPLPVIVKVTAGIIPRYPKMTSFFEGNSIHYYDHLHFGIAIDTGNGLKVASLENPANLNFLQIQNFITEFTLRDLRREFKAEDMKECTFTLTDLSQFNVLHFQPIINGRQSCILGVGGDLLLDNPQLTLTLAFDHRVLTGREVAGFLNEIKSALLAFGEA